MSGTVKTFNAGRGFGFIERPGDRDIFFHVTGVLGRRDLIAQGDEVEFETIGTDKGPKAVQVRVVRAAVRN